MTEHIGSEYVEILPDASGFAEKFRAQTVPKMDEIGREAGQRFARAFLSPVERDLAAVFRRARPGTDREAAGAGQSAGDKFGRALDERVAAAIKALPNIRIDADSSPAQRKIYELRAELEAAQGQIAIGVDDERAIERIRAVQIKLEELTGPTHSIRIRMDAKAALAEIAALQAALRGVDDEPGPAPALKKADEAAHSLLLHLIPLVPTIGPLVGTAVAGAAALGELGVAGIAAFKGIQAAEKAGTQDGLAFAAGVRSVKDELGPLGASAAHGLLDGFETATDNLATKLPGLNSEIERSAHVLGVAGANVAGGLLGGFDTFEPVMRTVDGLVVSASRHFEDWATGPGGADFAANLSDDLAHVVPLVEDLVGAGAHLFAAFHAPGTAVIDFLDAIARGIEAIPTPLLEAATTAYIAYRTAVTVTAGLDAASAALARLTGAETAAAAGSARLAASGAGAAAAGAAGGAAGAAVKGGIVAGIASRVVPIAAVWAGAAIGFGALDDATQKWRGSIDETKNALGDTVKVAHDLFAFHWGDLADDLTKLPDAQNAARADHTEAQRRLDVLGIGNVYNPLSSNPFEQFAAQQRGIPADYAQNAKQASVFIGDQEIEVARLRAQMQSAGPVAAQLQARMTALSVAGREDSNEFRQLYQVMLLVRGGQDAVGKQYVDARAKLAGYQSDLKSYRTILKEISTVADHYAQGQSTKLSGLLDTTFAKNPSLTGGISGLGDYQKTLQQAIKSEESWTKVTDDNTIKIRGNTYETKAWDAALAASHNNAARAAGLLLGHTRALDQDNRMAAVAADEQQNLSGAVGAAEIKYHLSDAQLNEYAAALGITSQQLATGTISQHEFVAGVGEAQTRIDEANTSTAGWIATLLQFDSGTDTAASRAQLLAGAMVSLNGPTLEYASTGAKAATANQQFVTDFGAVRKGVVNLRTGFIDFHNAGAAPLLSDLQGLQSAAASFAAETYQNEVATRGRTRAAQDAADVYRNDTRGALMDEASQLGITRGEAQKLADRYFKWPKDAETQIKMLGADDTNTLLNGIGEQLAILTGHPWTFTVDAQLTPTAQKFYKNGVVTQRTDNQGNAGGNTGSGGARGFDRAPDGMFSVGEEGTEIAIKDGPNLRIVSHPQAVQLNAALGGRFPGFAGGTGTGHGPGGFSGVQGTGSGSGGSSSSGSSSSTSAADKAAADLAAARQAARSDLEAFLSAIGITTNAITAAEHELGRALDKAKVSNDEQAQLQKEMQRLVGLTHAIATEDERISKAQTHLQAVEQRQQAVRQAANQEASSIRSSILGLFDLSSAGVQQQVYRDRPAGPTTGKSILADLTSAADTGAATEQELAQLKGHIPDALYESLAGNATADQAQIEALAGASDKTLSQIEKQYQRLHKAAKGTGADVVDELFGGKLDKAGQAVDVAKALLNGVDPAKNPGLAKAVKHLSTQLFGAGKETARGLAEGLIDERTGLRRKLRQLGGELADEIRDDLAGRTPNRHSRKHGGGNDNGNDNGKGKGKGGNNSPDVQVNFNGPVNDPRAVENHVEYALERASRRGRH